MRTTYTYNEGINFLRAVSILGIVLYHIFPFAMKGGFLGVCFFFLISGYLAAKKGQIDWDNESFRIRKYYIKKGLRIYPALYIMDVVKLKNSFQFWYILNRNNISAQYFF